MLVLELHVNSLFVILLGRLAHGCLALLLLGGLVIVLGDSLSALLAWRGSLLGSSSALLALQLLQVLTIREVSSSVRRKERRFCGCDSADDSNVRSLLRDMIVVRLFWG